MKKIVLLIITILIIHTNMKAQTWYALANGTSDYTYTVCADTNLNMMYAGGAFVIANGLTSNFAAKWNGSVWDNLGMDMGSNYSMIGTSDTVKSYCVYNNTLYVGGKFLQAEGFTAKHIAKYNGVDFSNVGTGTNRDVLAMAVYNGDLYAGGKFDSAGGVSCNHIAKWDGTSWTPVGSGLNNEVRALYVWNNNLYAGGLFDSAGTVACSRIAKWDGSNWTALGTGITTDTSMTNQGLTAAVNAIGSYGNELFVGGMFHTAGGNADTNLAKWNGTFWSGIGTFGNNTGDYVGSICTYLGNLFVGGSFITANADTVHNIAKWDGNLITDLLHGSNGPIVSMTVMGGALFVGGHFTGVGTINAFNVARWAEPAGINEINDNISVSIYPNPANESIQIIINDRSSLVKIKDVLGNTILSTYDRNLSVKNLAQGIYMVEISNAKGIQKMVKFIKI